jgi:hypothetical protein
MYQHLIEHFEVVVERLGLPFGSTLKIVIVA